MVEKEKIIENMASYISGLDIDEDICKKMSKINGKRKCQDNDVYSCMECIIEFFSKDCTWKASNDVCVNSDCDACADFVSAAICGRCRYKNIIGGPVE